MQPENSKTLSPALSRRRARGQDMAPREMLCASHLLSRKRAKGQDMTPREMLFASHPLSRCAGEGRVRAVEVSEPAPPHPRSGGGIQ